ncbi:tetraacyldisaccharide 4'-kinase [Flocculibacter collagenilyticus]|uniref:tetraacyldisaccharide 4'-kinase n=1 Tax=Flocculibacter collagenilyticus TaxID=2744479 RepID=UPI0018F3BC3F|nr:tetraacyldisaccharide 4'-kinase [Flocculibacter collagenilyticus]
MSFIEKGWYKQSRIASTVLLLLSPLSLLFYAVSTCRRFYYTKWVQPKNAQPLIVVGNISVGGNGKTPFVIWLCHELKQQGFNVGVISRGYGGECDNYPLSVTAETPASLCGDEPKLISQITQCPVVVGPNRNANIQMLNQAHNIDYIISDDGMQHYAMARDVEVAIVDAKRMFGNRWLLPVGPLRELVSRLKSTDFVIYNGQPDLSPSHDVDSYQLIAQQPINIQSNQATDFAAMPHAHAICGIGNPQRFSNTLKQNRINTLSFTAFSDHHHYTLADFDKFGDEPVIMTEKDAVKCAAFAKPNWWYLPVAVEMPEDLKNRILKKVINVGKEYGL